jgi:hypothetical protein
MIGWRKETGCRASNPNSYPRHAYSQHAYSTGMGIGVFRDLLAHTTASDEAKDVIRWLRTCSAFLVKYPQ